MRSTRWFVVDISHFKGNPIHRAIVRFTEDKRQIVQFMSYEERLERNLQDVHYFEIVRPIDEMF